MNFIRFYIKLFQIKYLPHLHAHISDCFFNVLIGLNILSIYGAFISH